jgi:hypothetical protein
LTFSGTPGNADLGSIEVKVTADDGSSTMADTFRIAVNTVVIPPTAPPITLPPVSEPVATDVFLELLKNPQSPIITTQKKAVNS